MDSVLIIWLVFGLVLVIAEFILPGLVAVFIGMGAITVALLLHLQVIESLPSQFITFFISSMTYIFTLRLLVVRFYPSDREVQNINEVSYELGRIVTVSTKISPNSEGRVSIGESTWQARGKDGQLFEEGTEVRIVGRENITWLVEKV